MNNTRADSVLFEIEPLQADGESSGNQSTMVLAVRENATDTDNATSSSSPSHSDLLRQFQIYFVNLEPAMPNQTIPASILNNSLMSSDTAPLMEEDPMVAEADKAITTAVNNIAASGPTYWRILSNFLKNQANAFIGTVMMPINVGTKAMQQSVQEHAQYVLSGSRYGARVSRPIYLTAVRLGNIIDQLVLNITGDQVDQVEGFEFNSKQYVDDTIDNGGETLSSGARLVMQYAVRPIAAFTGFNIHLLGRTLTGLGSGIHTTGATINLAGDGLRLGAQSAVSAGATAVAWAMDNSTSFLPPTPRPTVQMNLPLTTTPVVTST